MEEYYSSKDDKSVISEKRLKISKNLVKNIEKINLTKSEENKRNVSNITHTHIDGELDSLFKNTYYNQLMIQNEFTRKRHARANGKSKRAPGEKSRRGTTLEAREMPLIKIAKLISNGDLLLKNIEDGQWDNAKMIAENIKFTNNESELN